MSNPIPGKQYTVVVGDTLSDIAARAYGDGTRWPTIFNANQSTLKSDDPDVIFPGEVLIIPELPELKKLKNDLKQKIDRDKNKISIIIGGRDIPFINSSVIRTMDTVADAFSGVFAWEPGVDNQLDQITAPYSYSEAEAYIGGELLVSGNLYIVNQEIGNSGRTKSLICFSKTADLIDSNLKPPYEKAGVTLLQRCDELAGPYGIKTIIDDGVDASGQFDRVTAREDDKIFKHLNSLARQRSLLLSSTREGDLLITQAKTKLKPVGTIEEGQAGTVKFAASFDGRKRFNVYRAITDTPDKFDKKIGIAKDDRVPKSRFFTFKSNDSTAGSVKKVAEWQRSKQLADALTIPFPVTGFYDPSGDLWQENTLVTVVSKTIGVPNGFTFLIRRVEYKEENGGLTSTLNLVPPQVYTSEAIVEPWG